MDNFKIGDKVIAKIAINGKVKKKSIKGIIIEKHHPSGFFWVQPNNEIGRYLVLPNEMVKIQNHPITTLFQ